MCPRAIRSLTRLWLVRKARQIQHNVSYCGIFDWWRVQAKSWTCILGSFWIQSKCNTQILHLRKGEQDRHIARLKHINSGRTWWCWLNMNKTTFPTSFCLRAGKHKRLIAVTEFCRNTIIQSIFLEPSDCLSRSNWSCATKIQNNVRRMVGKIQGTHAVQAENLKLYHAVVEESSEQLEYQSIDSQGWPCPSSTGFSETENPVCG